MNDAMHRTTLAALCKLVTDGTHDSPKLIKKGVPFIKGKHISGGRVDFASCDYISHEDHLAVIARSKPERGDTLFSNIGSVGDAAFVDTDREFSIKNVALFKPDHSKVDPKYLFYLLRSDGVRNEMLAAKSGSAQPFISLGALRAHQVNVHSSVETQRRIASILGAYDDLIEVNRRRIAVLDEMARELFEEWFVRFRFPGHEAVPILDTPDGPLPEGWSARTIGDLGDVVTGKTPSKAVPEFFGGDVPFVKIPDLHSSFFVHSTGETLSEDGAASQSNKTVPDGALCVSCIGTIGLVAITAAPCQTNQQINTLIPPNQEWTEFLYFSLVRAKPHFINLGANGATIGNVNKKKFSDVRVSCPTSALLRAFHKQSAPMFALIRNVEYANHGLASSRDLLLPRLISGQLSVAHAERELEEAA
ncbi:restriction endonuclease subunit S [Sphingobium yanoikuyae]|uniref:restriction endonuclease subunit S n=1 Tax=Sphingobium yanoikuyae TaxID=13690 RepID=UPI0035B2C3CA